MPAGWFCSGKAALVVDQYVEQITNGGQRLGEGRQRDSAASRCPAAGCESTRTQEAELVMSQNRFGSLELEITAVRFLDAEGQPIDEFRSGNPLRIEIDFRAPASNPRSHFPGLHFLGMMIWSAAI